MTSDAPRVLPRTDGLTICIPNWNHRRYLARSVGSARDTAIALAEHGIPCQILVIDDKSRDGSQRQLAAMSMLGDVRIDVVFAAENQGLARTRNSALLQAEHRYACLLDADNELVPENAYTFYRAISETNAAVAYGPLLVQSGESVERLYSSDVVADEILLDNSIDAFCFVNVEIILAVGGYTYEPAARAREDWELILHLMAEGQSIVFVPMVAGRYYRERESMIATASTNTSGVQRMYNQRANGMPISWRAPRVFHPEFGFLT